MKRIFLVLVASLLILPAFAQEEGIKKKIQGDRIVVDMFTDIWQDAPDTIDISGFNRGVNFYFMNDFSLTRNLSFGVGVGIGCNNMYSNANPIINYDLDSTGTISYANFTPLADSIEYKKNKLSLTYIDIPLELRFQTETKKDKKVRAAVGFKVGWLLNNHTKYRGDNFLDITTAETKFKRYNIAGIENLRYGVHGRVGYGWVNLTVHYYLSKLFEKDKGPQMYPISVGLSITPF